jgi:hypothetical protein
MFKRNNSYIKIFILLSLQTGLINCNFEIKTNTFSNAGQMSGPYQNINVNEKFENNGVINGTQEVNIECGNLTGKGQIKGPKINIIARNFNFTGTIDCSKECTITTLKKIDQTKFKRTNKGKFKFFVDPKLNFESKKPEPVNPIKTINLNAWWEDSIKSFDKELKPNCSICRIVVQFDNKAQTNSKLWQDLKNHVDNIDNFIKWEAPFINNPFRKTTKTLDQLINNIAFEEIQKSPDIICTTSLKTIKVSEIKDLKVEDSLNYSPIILCFIILFDHETQSLNNIFSYKNYSPRNALNLFYTANDKSCKGYFYFFKPFGF